MVDELRFVGLDLAVGLFCDDTRPVFGGALYPPPLSTAIIVVLS